MWSDWGRSKPMAINPITFWPCKYLSLAASGTEASFVVNTAMVYPFSSFRNMVFRYLHRIFNLLPFFYLPQLKRFPSSFEPVHLLPGIMGITDFSFHAGRNPLSTDNQHITEV